MSKIIHQTYGLLNPAFNMTYAILQNKNIKTYAYPNSTESIGEVIKNLGYKKPLFVTDKGITRLNLLESTIKSLEKSGLSYAIYDGVLPDPTTNVVEEGAEFLIKNNCDSVISFGGGSSIDAAKVISGLGKNPSVKKYMGLVNMLTFSRKNGNFPIFAIPTTAGTGAEVTMGAVISHSATHKKDLVVDKKFVSKHVFLDPNLTLGLPAHVTTSTAFDALTHAIEAYVSKFATEDSKKKSLGAIIDIFKYLPIVYKNGKDVEARLKILVASNDAGMAIGRAHIGSVHSIGHNTGATFGIPHGLIIGVTLPYICEIYQETCKEQFAILADAINVTSPHDSLEIKSSKFVKAIWSLSKEVNMPRRIKDMDKSKFSNIADMAVKESYLYPIPMYVSREQFVEILNKIS